MAAPALTEDELFEQELNERLGGLRRDRVSRLGQDAVTWLALCPGWTRQLADACGFPRQGQALDEFLKQAQRAALCEVSRPVADRREDPDPLGIALEVASYLTLEQLQALLRAVAGLPLEGRSRADALVELAPSLPELLVEEALGIARDLPDPSERGLALAAVLTVSPEPSRRTVADAALEAVRSGADDRARAATIVALLPRVPIDYKSALADMALQLAVSNTPVDWERARLLSDVAPYLSESQSMQARPAAMSIRTASDRADALIALAPRFKDEKRREALDDAEESLTSIPDEPSRTRVQCKLGRALAEAGDIPRALRTAEAVSDMVARAYALGLLVQPLAMTSGGQSVSDLTRRALELFAASADPVRAIVGCATFAHELVSAGLRDEASSVTEVAVKASTTLWPSRSGAQALASLLNVLAEIGAAEQAVAVQSLALSAAFGIEDPLERCAILTRMAAGLAGEARTESIRVALEAARTVASVSERARAIIGLLPHLDPEVRAELTIELLQIRSDSAEDTSFWMPDPVRVEVLDELRKQDTAGGLASTARTIGQHILEARDKRRLPVAAPVGRWAEVAIQPPGAAVPWLNERVDRLIDAGDTGSALAWATATTTLAAAIGGELSIAALAATRRVELVHRREQDKRHLRTFLPREALDLAFRNLLATSEYWALHFIGMGGVGKTMLMRHITAQLADEMGLIVSRVDFDHLSADYPVRKPGQLLLELADELEPFIATGRHEQLFSRFRAQVVALHEQLSDEPTPEEPLRNVRNDAFTTMLRTFCGVLQLMPTNKQVVLILDTCEELAKLRPLGAMLPSVEATFLILELMHDQLASVGRQLRVVFAGRRLLAQSGFGGWHATTAAALHGAQLLPVAKPYLALQEIRGFDGSEARRFFADVRRLPADDDLMTAVLEHSPDPGSAPPIEWTPPRAEDSTPRFNPFDLALYADWLTEVPTLAPTIIASGEVDSYVEVRILQRINQRDVLVLLPAVVLLRRFDKEMLRAGFTDSDMRLQEALRELGGMEWIDHQGDFLEVDRNLRPRMQIYFERQRGPELEAMHRRLASGLRKLVDQRRPGELEVDHVDSALRMLDGPDAARLWNGLAQKIAEDGAWDWAQSVVTRLLGEDGAVYAPQHPARAGVRAVHIAAVIHKQAATDVSAYWREVADTAANEPDARVADWLQRRARLGAIATAHQLPTDEERTWLDELLLELRDAPADLDAHSLEQLDGALCAALETLLELSEQSSTGMLVSEVGRLDAWAARLEQTASSGAVAHRGLAAFAHCLAARAHALAGDSYEASQAFAAALRLILDARDVDWRVQPWADWRAPARMPERVRLEALRWATPGAEAFTPLDEATWWTDALVDLHSIDAERLASALLARRLAWQVPEPDVLEVVERADGYGPDWDRQPRCNAHRVIPPLFTCVARGWVARGDATRVMRGLDLRLQAATSAGQDDVTVRAGQLAKLHVVRRMRLHDVEISLLGGLSYSPRSADEATTAWAATALTKTSPVIPPPGLPLSPSMIHAWWRSQPLPTRAAAGAAVASLSTLLGSCEPAGSGFDELSVALDIQEASLLEESLEVPPAWRPHLAANEVLARSEIWLADHPGQMEHFLRLLLRRAVLPDPGYVPNGLDNLAGEWAARVGQRLLAELAHDEGELLALRLPAEGTLVLAAAQRWFETALDPFGYASASITFGIAAAHAGRTERGVPALRSAYGALAQASGGAPLPELDELMAVLDQPEPHFPELPERADWQGWLDRLVAQLSDAKRGPQARALLVQRYGSPLPIELESNPFVGIATAEAAAAEQTMGVAASPVVTPQAQRTQWITNVAIGVVGLLGAAGIYALIYLGVGFGLDAVVSRLTGEPVDVGLGAKILGTVIALFALGSLVLIFPRARSWFRAWLASRGSLQLTIRPGTDLTTSTVALVLLQKRARARLAWPPYVVEVEYPVIAAAPTPGLVDYGLAALALPPEITAPLATLQNTCSDAVGAWTLELPLVVDSTLAGGPWEALFALALPATEGKQSIGVFDFWRSGRSRQPSAESLARPVRLLADSNWMPLARTGWSAFGAVEESSAVGSSGERGGDAGVLHVIGTPVKTSAGLHIRLGGGTSATPATAQQSRETTIRSEVPLVRAATLAVGPQTVVIMQAQPADAVERLAAERELAQDWRSTAADVFSAGAGAVLVVPTLPAGLAEAVLGDVAQALRHEPAAHLRTLLKATRTVRERIAGWPVPSTESASSATAGRVELALEVTLFARPEADSGIASL